MKINKKILITGSYNGQDSLGDECLLKAVTHRIQTISPDIEIVFQLHNINTGFLERYAKHYNIYCMRGVQSFLWRTEGYFQRLKFSANSSRFFSLLFTKILLLGDIFSLIPQVKLLKNIDVFLIFGGTQFSGQWFALNSPAYFLTARIIKLAGGNIFFGPQQFGPLSSVNSKILSNFLKSTVDDWRTRNHLDLELLETNESDFQTREIYDEVFSATGLYPTLHSQAPLHILCNLRNMTFDDDSNINEEKFIKFSNLLNKLANKFNLPIILFGVSDSTFCDDSKALDFIKSHISKEINIRSVGRLFDEHQLFNLAQNAKLTISMSFHGCILSGIGGSPFIPVTEGEYYDYKYVDFDKYTGHQDVPLITLSSLDVDAVFYNIIKYVERFDSQKFKETRLRATKLTDHFYNVVCGSA